MAANNMYIVSIFNTIFDSLEDAKWNVKISLTRSEAKKYLHGEKIIHYIGDKLLSETPILVDEDGNITFGRTRKVM